MTNSEYENACITAAAEPCHTYGLNKLAAYDSKIAEVEKTLAGLQEGRREVINRYDLNKCKTFGMHQWLPMASKCIHCGKTLAEAQEWHFGVVS